VNAPPDFLLFLGRLHPLLVHLPIGLIILLATLEIVSRFTRYHQANSSAGWTLALAVPMSIGTAVCGWMLSLGGGYEDRLLQWHKWTGIATSTTCVLAAVFYLLNLKKAYRFSLFGSLLVLTIASHFGGSLTHGSDYLTRYAPGPLKSLLGGGATPGTNAQTAQATGTNPSAHALLIQPILQEYCTSCHGPEKSKGGLRLDSLPGLMKGGKGGLAVIAGKPDESDLIKRMGLPVADEDHMPPEGKPQPGADEFALLRWWIESGAPGDKQIGELKTNPKIAGIVAKRVKTSVAESSAPKTVEPKSREQVTALAASLASDLGIPITALSEKDAWVQCNASVAGKTFDDNALAKLSALGPNMRWLDLGGTAITDTGLKNLSGMPNLTRLHLERTQISDEGLAALASLNQLEYLNLYGTQVSETGLEHLNDLPKLRQLYLWQTKVTPEAAKAFADARTDKDQLRSWEQEIEDLKAKIKDAHMTVQMGVDLTAAKPAAEKPVNAECPVSGKPVDPTKTVLHEGKLIAFCCDDCKAKFQQDPKAFLAKLEPFLKGTAEPKLAAINTECPVSGKPVNPEKTTTYEGKLIAFCCDDCKASFLKDPKPFLSKLPGTSAAGKAP
jgi:YHS domain-containing protein/uncharacterized membrane protein